MKFTLSYFLTKIRTFMFDLKDKVAIVTGAGSGIGKSIAITFAKQGAKVVILERNSEASQEVCEEIAALGGQSQGVSCDVSNSESVKKVVADIHANYGKIDILVNNAGIAHVGNVLNTSEDDFDKIYQVNVKGVFNCLQAVLEHMVQKKSGVILNVASIASKIGIADRFAYSMSKGAVHTMTLSVAKDFVKSGIRCNCLCPARIHTPFVDGFIAKNYPGEEKEVFQKLSDYQPMGRMGQPDEIGALALYLCSDESAFVTGSAYDIDGGVMSLI
jgi:NAD(P)-dependent dehydrogenase (short-subunit alcohol dehydrogenase family)